MVFDGGKRRSVSKGRGSTEEGWVRVSCERMEKKFPLSIVLKREREKEIYYIALYLLLFWKQAYCNTFTKVLTKAYLLEK